MNEGIDIDKMLNDPARKPVKVASGDSFWGYKKPREMARQYKELEDKANTDFVTGLPNEKALDSFLSGLSDLYRRDRNKAIEHKGSFIAIDIVGLHETNDIYGRNAGGDEYLKKVAETLVSSVRPEDRCFRLGTGSDEFVIHLHGAFSRQELNGVMDRIDGGLKEKELESQSIYPEIKFGLSYAATIYEGDYMPINAYTDAVNSLGDAKKSREGKRVGDVGRIFVR
jgi:diguanylate cyclase (GGDEF)-like protein